ncbi:sterol desaturase family protein [Oceanicoccus sp. KOV_DT_Chl]|uniref:sterol desaturase family protein n=1 Tax=Oceanicoccus sp. KOV_DT_Chl TaxID=1904639 RepID=UPI000C7976B6|nr:sterol desaturase family protein [Oceanicoccus sp. KOV_DT_Chl]
MEYDVERVQSQLGIVVFSVFFIIYFFELISGRMRRFKRPLRDAAFSLAGLIGQPIVSGALLGGAAGYLLIQLFPESSLSLIDSPIWLAYLCLFFTKEFLHYWIHRKAHEWRWMWKLHRTHHSGLDMSVGLMYRYNIFWMFLLPQPWMGAFSMYTGIYEAYALAVLTSYLCNVLTHTSFRWDIYLREMFPRTEPVWLVLEKVITLPDAHHAHHAYGSGAHPNGNYAVTLFFIDHLFETAKHPHQRQQNVGLPISPRLHWAEELLWPMIKKPLLPKVNAVLKND